LVSQTRLRPAFGFPNSFLHPLWGVFGKHSTSFGWSAAVLNAVRLSANFFDPVVQRPIPAVTSTSPNYPKGRTPAVFCFFCALLLIRENGFLLCDTALNLCGPCFFAQSSFFFPFSGPCPKGTAHFFIRGPHFFLYGTVLLLLLPKDCKPAFFPRVAHLGSRRLFFPRPFSEWHFPSFERFLLPVPLLLRAPLFFLRPSTCCRLTFSFLVGYFFFPGSLVF